MSRRSLDQAHTYREIHSALERSPALVSKRNGGRHTVYVGPNGSVPVPNHAGDAPRGTLHSICKMAALAGLSVLVLALVYAAVTMV